MGEVKDLLKESKNSSKRSSHIVITKKVWIRCLFVITICYRIKKKKALESRAYLRVSREDGKERESDSIDSQRKVIRSYLKKEADICLVREWIDDGVSGIRFDREGFEQMLCAIQAGTDQLCPC